MGPVPMTTTVVKQFEITDVFQNNKFEICNM